MKKLFFPLMFCGFLSTTCSVLAMDEPTETSSKTPPKKMTAFGLHKLSGGQLSHEESLSQDLRQAFNHAVDKNSEKLAQNFFKRFNEIRPLKKDVSAVFKPQGSSKWCSIRLGHPRTQRWDYDLNHDPDKKGLLYCFKILTETGKNRDYLLSENKNLTKFSCQVNEMVGNPDRDRRVYTISYEEESENAPIAIVQDFYLVEGREGPISDVVEELNAQQ